MWLIKNTNWKTKATDTATQICTNKKSREAMN